VSAADGSAYQPLSPAHFGELLVFVKRHFELKTFAELEIGSRSGKPQLILSFDDGYRDFIDVAVPILERHRVRVNQNIIPACVEGQSPPLNVLAQDFIGKSPAILLRELIIPGLATKHLIDNRSRMGLLVSSFLKNKPFAEQQRLSEELIPQFFRFDQFKATRMMSRSEITQLVDTHEFGAHSYSHASMGYESDEYFKQDLTACRDYFRMAFNRPVQVYAFPNGSHRQSQIQAARAFEWKHVLLVGDLFSHCEAEVHHRFGFEARSRREAVFRAVGGFANPMAPGRRIV
jgi:peptidoglycan/xylan/chitin deacetylase (PgdA/CDA1 family)